MAAGFLHDTAHGPFSHAVHHVLKTYAGKTHEEISSTIIPRDLGALEEHGISINSVIKIINDKHTFPFISAIINSQLDADKLDYLLRDAHNVGYKYSFDLDHFINHYTIIGNENNLANCILGLKNFDEAIVTAEVFTLIWKSMYDLVYHVEGSRIAEKMLEKATLSACKDHSDIRDLFSNSSEYIKLDDDMLLGQLEKIGGYSQKMVERIKRRDIFTKICEVKLEEEKIEFLPAIISRDTDELSEKLTEELCSEFEVDQYRLICDVFKTRSPKKIHIDCLDDTEEPIDILSRSQVILSIKPKSLLRIYSDPIIQKNIDKDTLKTKIIDLLENIGS